jgi:hypothetical protein
MFSPYLANKGVLCRSLITLRVSNIFSRGVRQKKVSKLSEAISNSKCPKTDFWRFSIHLAWSALLVLIFVFQKIVVANNYTKQRIHRENWQLNLKRFLCVRLCNRGVYCNSRDKNYPVLLST